jgi:branched-chain amino acid transport system substrate-binding protein
MNRKSRAISRRGVLKGAAAAGIGVAAVPTIFKPAFAVPATVKIGLVGPRTGALALFYEEMAYAIDHVRRFTQGKIKINGTTHPLEIIAKDSQSNPNRASEVAQELILSDKVHVVTAFATPETVNPVADQCELNGMPCVSNDDPLESYFFGRKGDLKKGFEWTYNFFFSGHGLVLANMAGWLKVPTNHKLGVLWANDDDGRTFAKVMPPVLEKGGLNVIDPGRFDLPASNFTTEISLFKSNNVEVIFTVIPGPDFTVFWNQCAQQGFKPKVLTAGKVSEFPQGVYPFGKRAINFMNEMWWVKTAPYHSSITGQSSMAYADEYERDAKQQASMALGFRHSLLEVPIDALKRTQKLDVPASIRDAVRDTKYHTIVGPIDFRTGPFPNCSETKLAVGQWRKGKKWPLEMVVVDNTYAPNIPVQSKPEPITYS